MLRMVSGKPGGGACGVAVVRTSSFSSGGQVGGMPPPSRLSTVYLGPIPGCSSHNPRVVPELIALSPDVHCRITSWEFRCEQGSGRNQTCLSSRRHQHCSTACFTPMLFCAHLPCLYLVLKSFCPLLLVCNAVLRRGGQQK